MAKISIDRISDVQVNRVASERTHLTEGAGSLDRRVRERYEKAGYHLAPKSKAEAQARGQRHFNGLMSSFPRLAVYPSDNGATVSVDIMPTRYLVGQAARDVISAEQLSFEQAQEMSPRMANVSLLVPVRMNNQYGLLSQIKGDALGSGQLHAALAAGNVSAKYLHSEHPLVTTLQHETSEEVGINLAQLDSTSFVFLIDEATTGQVNFASISQGADMDAILGAYEASVRQKLGGQLSLEVAALAYLPIASLAFIPLEGTQGLADIETFVPTKDGLESRVRTTGIRPYTQAVVEFMRSPENRRYLLEQSGL